MKRQRGKSMNKKFFEKKRIIVSLTILVLLITQPLILNLSAQSQEEPFEVLQSNFDFVETSPIIKTYGDPNFTVTAEGGVGTGLVTYEVISGPGTISSNTGEVAITGAGLIEVKATKAADIDNAAEEVTLTINVIKATLTATTTNQTSVYGGTIPALPSIEVVGFVLGETADTADGYTAPVIGYTNVPGTLADAGPYGYTINGGSATNYSFTYDTTKRLLITRINQPALTFAAASITKTYGDGPFTNLVSGGGGTGELTFESSDTNKATVDSTGQVTIKGAGTVVITASKVGDINYANMATESYVLTINKKNLMVTADNKSKNYLEVNPDLTFRYTGFVPGDDVSKLTGIKPFLMTTADANSPVGTYPIFVNVVGTTDANYKFVRGADATLTIIAGIQPSLSFENDAMTKIYGEGDFTNVISGGAGTGALAFESSDLGVATVDSATGVVSIKGAGTATITATKAGDANYSNTVTKNYTLTINRATLVAVASDETMVAGQVLPTVNIEITGFKYSDTVNTARGYEKPKVLYTTNGAIAGTYAINITGGKAEDYSFTYTPGTLTVNPVSVSEPAPEVKSVPEPEPDSEPEDEPEAPENIFKQLVISKTGSSEGGEINKIKGDKEATAAMKNEESTRIASTTESVSEAVTTTIQEESPTKMALPVVSNIATTLIMSMVFVTLILRKRYLKETLKKQLNRQENKPLRKILPLFAGVLIVGQIGTYIYGISNLDNGDIVSKVNTIITIGTLLLGVTYIGIYQSIIRQIEMYKRMI